MAAPKKTMTPKQMLKRADALDEMAAQMKIEATRMRRAARVVEAYAKEPKPTDAGPKRARETRKR